MLVIVENDRFVSLQAFGDDGLYDRRSFGELGSLFFTFDVAPLLFGIAVASNGLMNLSDRSDGDSSS